MARVRGTTTRAGKTTMRKAAQVVADVISRPHSGRKVKKVGAQSRLEGEDLSGQNGRRANSVRQVGPSTIRPNNGPTGKVKYVGTKNFEDVFATRGLGKPYSRQRGSVKHVGPASREYSRALEGSGSTGSFRSGNLPRSSGLITETPLLKSGVGRTHASATFAGQPGSFKGNQLVRVAGGAGESVLVNGRSRRFGANPEGSTQVTPDGPTIVH